ncbi:hypothetical protein OG204_10845 [Streptomyces sp. NBC_01387]|uniref:hypothetical protein n=1 Tax=Streptomyces sp. NBC_01387 TaxID=2903849 RepID=UPI003251BE9C
MDLTQQSVAPRGGSSSPAAAGPVAPAVSGPGPADRVRIVLREPFRAETWRRMAYIVLALPVTLLCIPLALAGGPVGRIQRGLARRLLRVDAGEPARTGPLALVHAVVSSPLNLVALTVCGYFWTIVVINFGFPLRTDGDPSHSWGGPTMAGAWAVHAVGGGVTFLFLTPWVAKGFTDLQTRLVSGFLGADRTGLARHTWIALGIAAVCALLSVPVIHQL